jgi:cell wall-associated NlpC family hydrolase
MPPTRRSAGRSPRRLIRRPAPVPGTARLGRAAVVAVLAVGLLGTPAALAGPADPDGAKVRPGYGLTTTTTTPAPKPSTRGAGSTARAVVADDLPALRAKAARLRAKLDTQHNRLEVLSEELEEAYERGVKLLAEASGLDDRRRAAERELASAQGELDERARSSYIAGPGWFVSGLIGADDPADALQRLPLQRAVLEADMALVERVERAKTKLDATRAKLSARLVEQAQAAQGLDKKRNQAERLAAGIQRELRTMDRRVATLIEEERQREEASQRAAFADFMASAQARGQVPALDGRASAAARKAVAVALAQLGAPYQWGAEGPSEFDCSGLTSFAYAAAGVTIPRVSRAQFAAYAGVRPVDRMQLAAGDLVFFADNPGNPSTIHHVGMYIGRGLMVEAPYTGAVVRTSSIWRSSYAGAVRPAG